MTAPSWLQSIDEGVTLRRYIGPADSLCRVMAGDVITTRDFLEDGSPYINTFLHEGIVRRMRWMVDRG